MHEMKRILIRMISTVTASLAAMGLLPLAAQAQSVHGIAAVVNDNVITTYDLRQRSLFMMVTQGIQPTEEAKKQILRQALRNLVDEQLQLQESRKYDQHISDQAVDQGIQRIIARNGLDINELARRLAQAGISIDTMRDQVRAEIAWQRIIGGLYGSRIRITDAQIDETLNRLTANADKPSYHVAEIYIEASPDIGGMEGAMTGAKAMIEQLQKGVPFQVLARQFSSAASAAKGGDIGWLHAGELRPEIDAVLPHMEKGQISKPIQVPGGVYVIALVDKRISKSETFYKLKQINYKIKDKADIPTARAALKKAGALIKSCETVKSDIEGVEGVSAQNMGEIKASELSDDIRSALEVTSVGGLSKPFVTPTQLVSVIVCDRQVKGSNIPTRAEVEDRLFAQQEAQASRRHLRDLRRKATIAIR